MVWLVSCSRRFAIIFTIYCNLTHWFLQAITKICLVTEGVKNSQRGGWCSGQWTHRFTVPTQLLAHKKPNLSIARKPHPCISQWTCVKTCQTEQQCILCLLLPAMLMYTWAKFFSLSVFACCNLCLSIFLVCIPRLFSFTGNIFIAFSFFKHLCVILNQTPHKKKIIYNMNI